MRRKEEKGGTKRKGDEKGKGEQWPGLFVAGEEVTS